MTQELLGYINTDSGLIENKLALTWCQINQRNVKKILNYKLKNILLIIHCANCPKFGVW